MTAGEKLRTREQNTGKWQVGDTELITIVVAVKGWILLIIISLFVSPFAAINTEATLPGAHIIQYNWYKLEFLYHTHQFRQ